MASQKHNEEVLQNVQALAALFDGRMTQQMNSTADLSSKVENLE